MKCVEDHTVLSNTSQTNKETKQTNKQTNKKNNLYSFDARNYINSSLNGIIIRMR